MQLVHVLWQVVNLLVLSLLNELCPVHLKLKRIVIVDHHNLALLRLVRWLLLLLLETTCRLNLITFQSPVLTTSLGVLRTL